MGPGMNSKRKAPKAKIANCAMSIVKRERLEGAAQACVAPEVGYPGRNGFRALGR